MMRRGDRPMQCVVAERPSGWSEMPEHLMETIMERLPSECYFGLRIVCKQWNRLLRGNRFVGLWNEAANRQPWLILCMPRTQMQCLLYSFTTRTWRTVPLSFGPERCTINYKGSAAGLLLVDIPGCPIPFRGRRCVCNPISRTWSCLPGMRSIIGVMAGGIAGGNDWESYKVLAVGKCRKNMIVAEVYNSITKSWTFAGKLPDAWVVRNEDMVYCNGSLYCMTVHDGIVGYSIEEKTWTTVPMPFPDNHSIWPRLVACGSSLLVAAAMEEDHVLREIIVWELIQKKENGKFCNSCWREIGRMGESLCEDFRRRSCSNWFECVGVGDYVCLRAHGSIEVLVYSLSLRVWDWLPVCPHAHGDCKYLRLKSLPLEPRPDLKV